MVATPVSRTATAVPAPVFPAAAALSLPILTVDSFSVGGTGTSSVTLRTPGLEFSASRPARFTRRVTIGSVSYDTRVWPASDAEARSVRWSVTTLTRTVPPLAVSSRSGGSTGPVGAAEAGLVPSSGLAGAGIAVSTRAAAVAVTKAHTGLFTYCSRS